MRNQNKDKNDYDRDSNDNDDDDDDNDANDNKDDNDYDVNRDDDNENEDRMLNLTIFKFKKLTMNNIQASSAMISKFTVSECNRQTDRQTDTLQAETSYFRSSPHRLAVTCTHT